MEKRAAGLAKEQADFVLDQLPPYERIGALQARRVELEGQLKAATGDSNDELEKRIEIQKELLDTEKELFSLAPDVDSALDLFFKNIDDETKRLGDLYDQTHKVDDVAKELGNTFSSAFEDAIVEGRKFKDVLKGLAQDILRLFVRQQISAPIAGFFGDLFKGIFGGGKAVGGEVDPSKVYLVGEKGPEAFVPNTKGTIIPAAQTAAMSSGGMGHGGNIYNIDARGADEKAITRLEGLIYALNGSIEHRAVAAVVDGKRRRMPGLNGAFA